MKKVLFVATVSSHIKAFHIPYLKHFQELGWETHVACNAATGYETSAETVNTTVQIPHCDFFHNISFQRSPLKSQNWNAYKQLKKIIDGNHFDIIHCHTPVGGAIGRLAAQAARKRGTRVFYTAHGFHFYKGAPKKNWIIYYPIEKFLARYTDCLITINNEDYELATSKCFKAKRIEKVNGVGIDLSRFSVPLDPEQRSFKRHSLGIQDDEIVLLSVGELSDRKNHQIVIKALSELKNPKIKYLICGTGELREQLEHLIESLGLKNQVYLMGFQKPVDIFYQISDIFVFPSLQEGLPVAVMEAMASGLPVIASNIRGNCDLVFKKGGELFDLHGDSSLVQAISCRITHEDQRSSEGAFNQKTAKQFSVEKVVDFVSNLYFKNE